MDKHVQLVLTSDGSGESWNVCAWNHTTGAALKTFKGGSSAPRTLSSIGKSYLISAQSDKPIINYWSLNSKDQTHLKMICPGRVSCLSVTSDGFYCAAAIDHKIHIWQICTGNLMAIVSKHYQTVTCVKFTDDGSYFVSGSDDTTVLAWSMSEILTGSDSPTHKWTRHSGPVTDVHVGYGGVCARVVSVSTDRTCQIYDLCSGTNLLSIVFDVGLTSVTLDDSEIRLFAGSSDGRIFQINLFAAPRNLEMQMDDKDPLIFNGHANKVSCLSVSSDGSMLVSGSNDATAKVWHVDSRHCLTTLRHKGGVTNAFFTSYVDSFGSVGSSSIVVKQFKRNSDDERRNDGSVWIRTTNDTKKLNRVRKCIFPK